MMSEVRFYENPIKFELDKESYSVRFTTVNKAIEFSRKEIAKVRGTLEYTGIKIFDTNGRLLHKMPSQ